MYLIAAVDQNWAIGCQNKLLARLSPDLKRFKALTLGHPVLLGCKTLETFPGGKPLPGRQNYILSTNPDYKVENALVLHSLEEARTSCPADTFVIGGAQVYRAALDWCDTAYITKIHASFTADAWMPDLDALPEWELAEEEPPLEDGGIVFHYATYRRKG